MDDHILPVINKTKLLGTIITNDLKWNSNTNLLIKRANQRMQLLRKCAEFTNSIDDRKTIYIAYIRSILEQSSVLWGSSISEENKEDLERVQKNSCRIILGNEYVDYEKPLKDTGLENLQERRKMLALRFGNNCKINEKTKTLFPLRKKIHKFKTRKEERFEIFKTKSKRLQVSTVPYLQRLLNEEYLNLK